MVGILGIFVLLGIAYSLSNNKSKIDFKLVSWGLVIQFLFALLILKSPIGKPVFSYLDKIITKLIKLNNIFNGYIYIQITRGVSERKHEFPKKYKPTTIIFTKHLNIDKKIYEKGVKIITIPDLRWLRRDIKTTSLLANVLSKQLAIEKNAFESWLIDNGNITEGSASNAWIIKSSNTIITHPANNKILKGVTRDTVIKILKKNNFNIKERPFNLIEAKNAKEAFLTSSTLSVLPVVKIDNYNLSNGKPGDITKKIMYLYNNYIVKNKNSLAKELKIA